MMETLVLTSGGTERKELYILSFLRFLLNTFYTTLNEGSRIHDAICNKVIFLQSFVIAVEMLKHFKMIEYAQLHVIRTILYTSNLIYYTER